MSLVAKANALKAELGIPPDMPAAAAIVAACDIMQITPELDETLYGRAQWWVQVEKGS